MTLPLLLAYAALVLLSLLALLASRWAAWFKGLLVLAVTFLYFHAYDVLDNVWGWPSSAALPERFVLLSVVVDEPNAKHVGGLFVWVHAIENGRATSEPRAYRLPYNKSLHLQLNEGTQKIRNGIAQMGIAETKQAPTAFGWMRGNAETQVIQIRDLAGTQLPEK